MRQYELAIHDLEKDCVRMVFRRVKIMRAPWTRARGLIGRRCIDPSDAYLFRRCPTVHTCFMSVPIDVIVCDKHLRVLHVETMKPWCTTSPKLKGAHTIIETAAGSAAQLGINEGCLLSVAEKELDDGGNG